MLVCLAAEEGVARYEVKLETGEVANLAAELGSAGFKSGAGISPGRLLRVAHALGRACLLTFKGGSSTELPRTWLDLLQDGLLVLDPIYIQLCLLRTAPHLWYQAFQDPVQSHSVTHQTACPYCLVGGFLRTRHCQSQTFLQHSKHS